PQQPLLPLQASRITGESAVAADDPMTGYDERNRIQRVRSPHRPRRAQATQASRQLAVGRRRTRFQRAQATPDALFELRSLRVSPYRIQRLQIAVEISLDPLLKTAKARI